MKLFNLIFLCSLLSISFVAHAMKRTAQDAQLNEESSTSVVAAATASTALAPAPSPVITSLISALDGIITKIETRKPRKIYIIPDIKEIKALLVTTQNINALHQQRSYSRMTGDLPLLLHALCYVLHSHVYYDVAQALLNHGADPNIQHANYLCTPLQFVASGLNKHDLELTRLLLARGVNVNSQHDSKKETPLKIAVKHLNDKFIGGSRKIKGPNAMVQYEQWRQQKEIKRKGYKQQVIDLLREHGGKEN